MEPVYLKYALFGEQPTVLATLQAFRQNYERVHSGLKAVWARIQDEESQTARISGELVKANEALRAAAGLGGHFFRKDPSLAPPPVDSKMMNCPECNTELQGGKEAVQCPGCGTSLRPENFSRYRQARQQQRQGMGLTMGGGGYGRGNPNTAVD